MDCHRKGAGAVEVRRQGNGLWKGRTSLSGGFGRGVRVVAAQKHKRNMTAMLAHIQQRAWDKPATKWSQALIICTLLSPLRFSFYALHLFPFYLSFLTPEDFLLHSLQQFILLLYLSLSGKKHFNSETVLLSLIKPFEMAHNSVVCFSLKKYPSLCLLLNSVMRHQKSELHQV